MEADFRVANFTKARVDSADLRSANFSRANLRKAAFTGANLTGANLSKANLSEAILVEANLKRADLKGANFLGAILVATSISDLDLSNVVGLQDVQHVGPSYVSTDTLVQSKGQLPEAFLRGCGLSDWEIEQAKLYDPDLSNQEIDEILYRVHNLRANQALQISPLFISYSHSDGKFVDKMGDHLSKKGIRFWRDIHDLKAGKIEKQIDQAISQNRTVLLVLSENSFKSDWVQHEVRQAREEEQKSGRDVLCPITLDPTWNYKDNRWPKRIMEQIMEYNILDFSEWQDDSKFESMFRKLLDGLELFYKG
jgi:hypothetical protein